jgi:hypothetical protein
LATDAVDNGLRPDVGPANLADDLIELAHNIALGLGPEEYSAADFLAELLHIQTRRFVGVPDALHGRRAFSLSNESLGKRGHGGIKKPLVGLLCPHAGFLDPEIVQLLGYERVKILARQANRLFHRLHEFVPASIDGRQQRAGLRVEKIVFGKLSEG